MRGADARRDGRTCRAVAGFSGANRDDEIKIEIACPSIVLYCNTRLMTQSAERSVDGKGT